MFWQFLTADRDFGRNNAAKGSKGLSMATWYWTLGGNLAHTWHGKAKSKFQNVPNPILNHSEYWEIIWDHDRILRPERPRHLESRGVLTSKFNPHHAQLFVSFAQHGIWTLAGSKAFATVPQYGPWLPETNERFEVETWTCWIHLNPMTMKLGSWQERRPPRTHQHRLQPQFHMLHVVRWRMYLYDSLCISYAAEMWSETVAIGI